MSTARIPIALAAAATVLGAATACSGGQADASGDGTIDVWIAFTDYRLDWAEERAREFNDAHEEFTVKIAGYDSYEVLFDAVNAAVGQGRPPAIVQYFEAATQDARDAVGADGEPLFTSIEAAIDGRDAILGEPVVLDDIVEAVRDYYTLDGEFASMPWNTSSTLFYGNADLLDAADLDAMPETWSDVEAACERIMALDDAPQYCITWPNHAWFVEQSVAQQGALLVNNDNGRADRATEVDLTSTALIDFVTWQRDLLDDGFYYYSGVQNDWDGPKNAFAARQTAFLMTSSGDATAVVADGDDAGFAVDVSRMPYNGDVPYAGNLIGGATLWLTGGLDDDTQDGALAFLQYLNNPENAADWHRTTGYLPITHGAEQMLEDDGWFDEHPYQRVANEQLALADGSPASTGALVGSFVSIREQVTAAVEAVLVAGADPAERLAEAQTEAQRLLDDYNLLYSER